MLIEFKSKSKKFSEPAFREKIFDLKSVGTILKTPPSNDKLLIKSTSIPTSDIPKNNF